MGVRLSLSPSIDHQLFSFELASDCSERSEERPTEIRKISTINKTHNEIIAYHYKKKYETTVPEQDWAF